MTTKYRKILVLILAAFIVLSMCSCGKKDPVAAAPESISSKDAEPSQKPVLQETEEVSWAEDYYHDVIEKIRDNWSVDIFYYPEDSVLYVKHGAQLAVDTMRWNYEALTGETVEYRSYYEESGLFSDYDMLPYHVRKMDDVYLNNEWVDVYKNSDIKKMIRFFFGDEMAASYTECWNGPVACPEHCYIYEDLDAAFIGCNGMGGREYDILFDLVGTEEGEGSASVFLRGLSLEEKEDGKFYVIDYMNYSVIGTLDLGDTPEYELYEMPCGEAFALVCESAGIDPSSLSVASIEIFRDESGTHIRGWNDREAVPSYEG